MQLGFGDLIKLCFVLDVISFLDFLFGISLYVVVTIDDSVSVCFHLLIN